MSPLTSQPLHGMPCVKQTVERPAISRASVRLQASESYQTRKQPHLYGR